MVNFTCILCALPPREDGCHVVHAYIGISEPTNTELLHREIKAEKDAAEIIRDILYHNLEDDPEQLLRDGEPPVEAIPLFAFAIGVAWDRANKLPAYMKIDYHRFLPGGKWNGVAKIGMELYEETYSVLAKRDKSDRKAIGAGKYRPDRNTIEAAKATFNAFADDCLDRQMRRMQAEGINASRVPCKNRHGDYCSPSVKECPCYKDGKCVEVQA